MISDQENDPYNLQRFLLAQDGIFEQTCSELRRGRKTGHWMWFIFPQLKGLGRSEMAERFAISSRKEAGAYLEHPILGLRLRECTRLVTQIDGRSIREIFGDPDDMKFRSSMTLFAHATRQNELFGEALRIYFGGQFDPLTLRLLDEGSIKPSERN